MEQSEGRADWLSLLVFCAALLLLAGALLAGNAYRWGAIALLLMAYLSSTTRALPANALSVSLGLYCAWLFANAAFVTPAYSAEDHYRPLALLGGFCVAAVLSRETQVQLFRAGAALLGLLVLIGLLQFFFGFWHLAHNPQRAAATFVTPNTFATAINLFLLPLAGLVLTRQGSRNTYALLLWLFAGLLATESRGGWLAFAAGLGFIAFFVGAERIRETRREWLTLIASLVAVSVVFSIAMRLAPPAGLTEAFGETILSRGTSYRIDIAMVTLGRIAEHPLAGAGAGMFRPLFEMSKPAELDIGASFPYAHNDYLQIWLEFGLTGLALLVAIIGAGLTLVLRARAGGTSDPLPLACGAAAAGFFTHALVDFPLYVPFLLLVIGLWLGAFAARFGHDR
ncbi:MAG: O-antigen ligase family protein, partial [Burkholderiales bacterium]